MTKAEKNAADRVPTLSLVEVLELAGDMLARSNGPEERSAGYTLRAYADRFRGLRLLSDLGGPIKDEP